MRKRILRQPPWQLGLAVVALAMLAGAIYLAGQALISPPADPPPAAQVDLPDPNETPEPGAIPNRTQPFWHIPYENQERLAPKFRGELNGIPFDEGEAPSADREARPYCLGWRGAPDWVSATAGTPFEFDPSRLPAGVNVLGEPQVKICADGRPVRLEVELFVQGAHVYIVRLEGERTWPQLYSEGRLSTGTVAGRSAVFVDQILEGFGESAAFIVDDDTGGSTGITAADATLELTIEIAQAVYERPPP